MLWWLLQLFRTMTAATSVLGTAQVEVDIRRFLCPKPGHRLPSVLRSCFPTNLQQMPVVHELWPDQVLRQKQEAQPVLCLTFSANVSFSYFFLLFFLNMGQISEPKLLPSTYMYTRASPLMLHTKPRTSAEVAALSTSTPSCPSAYPGTTPPPPTSVNPAPNRKYVFSGKCFQDT